MMENTETIERKSGAAVLVQRVVRHPAYVLTVIFVVMPMNGAIMARGQVWLGLVLMAMQLPWAIQRVCELCDKDA